MPASADSHSFNYDDSTVHVSGVLNTSSAPGPLNVLGGYLINGTESFNLLPGSGYSPSGAFIYDSLLSPGAAPAPMLTPHGLLFAEGTSGNPGYKEIDIWGNSGATDYTYYLWTYGAGYGPADNDEGHLRSTRLPSRLPARFLNP